MAAYDFKVDFSPLGTLPGLAQGYKERVATEEALAGLKSGKYQDVAEAAAAILRGGGSIDQATKLYNAATARYGAEQRGLDMKQYLEFLRTHPQPGAPASTIAPPIADPSMSYGDISVPTRPDQASTPAPGAPLPGVQWPAPPPVGQRSEALPSPTDAIITKAQAGMDPVLAAPATKLAGPLPTPDSAPPNIPSLALQSGQMQVGQPPGAQLQMGGPAQAPVPQTPAQAPQAAPSLSPQATAQQRMQLLQSETDRLAKEYYQLPFKGANSPAARQILDQYKRALDQLAPNDPKWREYQADNFQQVLTGNRPVTYREWRLQEPLAIDNQKEIAKAYSDKNGYREQGERAQKQIDILNQMDLLAKNPAFTSGTGQREVGMGIGLIAGAVKMAKDMGITEGLPNVEALAKIVDPATKSAAVNAAFNALSNKLIFETIGSLGTGISEGDRNFVNNMFPSLSLTKEGNELLSRILKPMAEKVVQAQKAAEDYRLNTKNYQQTLPGMDQYVRSKTQDSVYVDAKGNPTEAGKAAMAEAEAIIKQGGSRLLEPNPRQPAPPPRPEVVPRPHFGLLPMGNEVQTGVGVSPQFGLVPRLRIGQEPQE